MSIKKENPIPLLPCPWCGSDDVRLITGDDMRFEDMNWDPNYEAVLCRNDQCYAIGPMAYQNEALAIAAWNKGPYVDRFEIHAKALTAHAEKLRAKAEEHLRKAEELMAKAASTQ